MPIHDLGYRGWDGKRSSENLRWWVIAETGIRLAWQSRWIRRMFIAAWMPVIGAGLLIFTYEQFQKKAFHDLVKQIQQTQIVQEQFLTDEPFPVRPGQKFDPSENPDAVENGNLKNKTQTGNANRNRERDRRNARRDVIRFSQQRRQRASFGGPFADIWNSELWQNVDTDNEEDMRYAVWCTVLFVLFRNTQAFLMVLMIGLIAPPLISRDFRSRAFLVYFSRPLSAIEYSLGKGLILAAYLTAITTFPAICLYFLGILLSPELNVVFATWDIPFRIFLASLILTIPTASVALCLSSLTEDSRYAGFAWFAMWVMGFLTFSILSGFALNPTSSTPQFITDPDVRALTSPFHILGVVQGWAFGLRTDFSKVFPHLVVLTSVSILAVTILIKRVSKPMNI